MRPVSRPSIAASATIEAAMRPTDFCVITADHGNDPTFRGFDHTREHVPILAFGAGAAAGPIGARASFADVAETIAVKLGLPHGAMGAPGRHDLRTRRSARVAILSSSAI